MAEQKSDVPQTSAMSLSPDGVAFIRKHEGFVDRYYLDAARVPTIGFGFTMRNTAFRKWWADNRADTFGPQSQMTREEADDALRYIVGTEVVQQINQFLGGRVVPQNVFDAMVSMVYNCGPVSLKWRWARSIINGDYDRAAAQLMVTAVTAGGVRLSGLVNRRENEAVLISKGVYT